MAKIINDADCSIEPDSLDDKAPLPIFWEDTYAIVRALISHHPDVDLEEVSLGSIFEWSIALPGFEDDHELANDEIMKSIYQEWYEEVNPI